MASLRSRAGFCSRRAFLAGTGASVASLAAAPLAQGAGVSGSDIADVTVFAVADAASGAMLEAHGPERAVAPASVAKVLTALYALDALGGRYRFRTRLLATGPVEGGVVQGDLVLAGGGDPVLDTDALGGMAASLAAGGLTGVTGRFVVADGALPCLDWIEREQPAQASYNPSVSGLNLNFNRVYLEWEPGDPAPTFGFRAPGVRHSADAPGFGIALGGGRAAHGWQDGREVWTLPERGLAGRGGVWLPVREPAAYAGRVFRTLAARQGIVLPEAVIARAAPPGHALAWHDSPALAPMMRDMLHFSTNLTAEAAGLRSAANRGGLPADLAASAGAMTAWAAERYGVRRARFANHSGLTTRSAVAPVDMLRVLAAEADRLPEMLRERPVRAADGRTAQTGVRVLAKTGTLHFVSALAGYLEAPRGRRLVFAIFSADLARRAAVPEQLRDDPPGGDAWLARARAQQHALLRRWAGLHAGGGLRPMPRPARPQQAAEAG